MIQIYRIESKPNDEPDILIYNCCQSCAAKKKEEGYQITYDLYFSERYPDERKDDVCDICEDSFYVDGRTIKKGGFLKSSWDSIC